MSYQTIPKKDLVKTPTYKVKVKSGYEEQKVLRSKV